jgi:integration host factor subunit alpha
LSENTLTRADLVEAVVNKVGLPRHEAAELVEMVLKEISTTLANGEAVKLSSFGSFGIREKRQRIGRNPKTGQEVPITPRRVLVFRASNIMKKRIDSEIKAEKNKAKAKPKPKPRAKAKTSAKGKTAAVKRASTKK